jgi:hypothetical protein
MSGTPPPNYNPNDSLLSGGDSVKIMPVQGGGFMNATLNYNPDASLLSGGEDAKLIAVQGGGAKTDEIYKAELAKYEKDMKEYTLRKKKHTENFERKLAEYEESRREGEVTGPPPQKAFPESPPSKPLSPHTNLESINEENETNNTNTSNININTNNNINSTESEIILNDETIGDGVETIDNSEGTVENENENENETGQNEETEAPPLEIPCPAIKDDDEYPESFEATEDLAESKTKEVIRLASREFYIRKAKRKSVGETKDDEVMKDWKEGNFTEDEADFLNTLGLSPKLLYSSFYCHQKDWNYELAEFLYYLSVFTCYPASSLVLKGECQRVREFLLIVESNLKAEQLRKLAEKPVPVAGPITLPELEEQEDEDEEENSNGKAKGTKNGSNEGDHVQILNRLKNLDVDKKKADDTKSIAKKITDFFKSMKPSFLKSKDEKLYDSVLDEIFKLDKEGKLNSNQKNADVSDENLTFNINVSENEEIDEEEMKRQFDEKIKQLKIKKFMESLPDKYRNVDLSVFIQRMVEKK